MSRLNTFLVFRKEGDCPQTAVKAGFLIDDWRDFCDSYPTCGACGMFFLPEYLKDYLDEQIKNTTHNYG